MSKERRQHTPEFKREALSLIIDQHVSVAEVSRRLGISEVVLWLSLNVSLVQRHSGYSTLIASCPTHDI